MPIRFSQSCPTCGRRIEVQASLLGHSVGCQHCGSEFVASDCATESEVPRATEELMQRVERAISKAEVGSTTLQS